MKGWKKVKAFMQRLDFLSGILQGMPVPDFNIRIVYYEK